MVAETGVMVKPAFAQAARGRSVVPMVPAASGRWSPGWGFQQHRAGDDAIPSWFQRGLAANALV